MVAHPEHGVAVRKLFDPAGGAFSPEIVRRKEQLANLPGMAKVLGTTTGPQGTPIHFNEPIPGRELGNNDVNAFISARDKLRQEGANRGFHLADLRPQNAMVQPSGEVTFIDHMPLKPHEVRPDHASLPSNVVPVSADHGPTLFGDMLKARQTTPKHLMSPHMGLDTGMLPAKHRKSRFAHRERTYNDAFKSMYLGGKDPGAPKEVPIAEAMRKAYPRAAPQEGVKRREQTAVVAPPAAEQPPPLESSLFSQPPPLTTGALPTLAMPSRARAPLSHTFGDVPPGFTGAPQG
jgi:hypothetical protein